MREVLEAQRPSEWVEPDHNEKLPYATMAQWRAGDHGEPQWSRLEMLLSDYVYELMWDECRGSDSPFGKSPNREELKRRVQEAREQAAQKIANSPPNQKKSVERKLEVKTEGRRDALRLHV